MLNKVLYHKDPLTNDEIRGYKFWQQTRGKKGYWHYKIEYLDKGHWCDWQNFSQENLFLEHWNRLVNEGHTNDSSVVNSY